MSRPSRVRDWVDRWTLTLRGLEVERKTLEARARELTAMANAAAEAQFWMILAEQYERQQVGGSIIERLLRLDAADAGRAYRRITRWRTETPIQTGDSCARGDDLDDLERAMVCTVMAMEAVGREEP